jgi:hypothetical protein
VLNLHRRSKGDDHGAPALLGIPPLSDKVWGVREAQAHFGFDIPSEAHPDVRAKQHERVFDKGEKQHIGTLDVRKRSRVG